MSKTIAVTGATGAQGGSIARAMLAAGWRVRAITRDPTKESSQKLAALGCEVVAGNLDDKASLVKAFENAQAIFAVTNWWEHFAAGDSDIVSGEKEEAQAMALAEAAAATPTLEHYIWSTLPFASKLTNGQYPVPHYDYKGKVDDRIRAELPGLAAKTTFLLVGFYAQNHAWFPWCKPAKLPGYDKYVFLNPGSGQSQIVSAGDVSVNTGVFVRQVLLRPEASRGKYTVVGTEIISFGEKANVLGKVMGKPVSYVEVSADKAAELWGPGGAEIVSSCKFGEIIGDWEKGMKGEKFVGKAELGITDGELVNDVQALMPLKGMLFDQ